jgi:hypothetical protein
MNFDVVFFAGRACRKLHSPLKWPIFIAVVQNEHAPFERLWRTIKRAAFQAKPASSALSPSWKYKMLGMAPNASAVVSCLSSFSVIAANE